MAGIRRSLRNDHGTALSGRGDIKVMATMGGGALPVEGAEVTVEIYFGGEYKAVASGVTDSDGAVVFCGLPAMAKAASLAPEDEYAGTLYRVKISHPALGEQMNEISVFADTVSIWNVHPKE